MEQKKYWRCTVCGDLHFGVHPPKICPTCTQEDKYVEISKEEFMELLEK